MRTLVRFVVLLFVAITANAAVRPTFTSTPPLSAAEGVTYTYTVSATTPDSETIVFSLRGPTGAVLNGGNTVTWTPSTGESRNPNWFSITATSASGGEATQTFKVVPTGTVSGTRINHYLKRGIMAVDLSVRTVAAYVPDGTGGYNVIPGSGTSNGAFIIPNVPGGFYLLQLGGRYRWTRSSAVQEDFFFGLRANVVQSGPKTSLTYYLSNINPWQGQDIFELVAPNNAAFETYSMVPGTTTFAGNFPYVNSLSDASQGDQYFALQLITQNLGGFPFPALGRYLAVPKFTQFDGSNTGISGTMTTVPQTSQFEVNLNAADITQVATAVNPSVSIFDTILFLDVCPQSLLAGCATSTPDLVLYDFPGDQPFLTQNADLGLVFYGNPFPATWPLFVGYQWDVGVFYALPHSVSGTYIPGSIRGHTDQLPSANSPIPLLVSGATGAMLNGQNFSSNLTRVGPTPTLSWGPPSVGNASFYEVTVFQLLTSRAGTTSAVLANLRTSDTSLTIPPGLLSKGSAYVFRIRAFYVQGFNASQPNRLGPKYAQADVLSGIMRP